LAEKRRIRKRKHTRNSRDRNWVQEYKGKGVTEVCFAGSGKEDIFSNA